MICNMFTKILKNNNPHKENKALIVFDDMIAVMINNEKLNAIVAKLVIEVENLISLLLLLHNHILRYQKKLG